MNDINTLDLVLTLLVGFAFVATITMFPPDGGKPS